MQLFKRSVPLWQVVLVLGIVFVIWANGSPDAPVVAAAKATSPMVVKTTFADLVTSYNANSIAFDAKYKGKAFQLHGMVVRVSDSLAGPNVTVYESGAAPYWAIFKTPDGMKSLRPGDTINFVCESFDFGLQMDGCTLNKAN